MFYTPMLKINPCIIIVLSELQNEVEIDKKIENFTRS